MAEPSELDPKSEFLRDVLTGLGRPQKSIPPKYFYDDRGSALFEAICRTPEYYPTRTEMALLAGAGPEIAAHLGADTALVEFGSGASDKTRLLLDAARQISSYLPIDISDAALAGAKIRLQEAYPNLSITPVLADFTRPIRRTEINIQANILGFFPGSTIGNFDVAEAQEFLARSTDLLGPRASFLIGVDLVKDEATLRAAYDDSEGVTAAFNLNLLERVNRDLGADFQLSQFAHCACWNSVNSRMEMHLESRLHQRVRLAGRVFHFRPGETIHTENSYKFTMEGFAALAVRAGWSTRQSWASSETPFAMFLLERSR